MKRQRQDIAAAIISQNLIPHPVVGTPFGSIQFHCPNKEALEYPRDLLTREADTIEWISGFSNGEVFWDIGANVGAYSLFAALVTKAPVLAFEPSAQTFSLMVKNVELNSLGDVVWPVCIALSDRTVLDFLNMPHTYASSVFNVFGGEIDSLGNEMDVAFRQLVPGFRIDDFVRIFNPPAPNHIKIDVDSVELQILEGGRELLANETVKSVLIEVMKGPESSDFEAISRRLESAGFRPTSSDRHPGSDNVIFTR